MLDLPLALVVLAAAAVHRRSGSGATRAATPSERGACRRSSAAATTLVEETVAGVRVVEGARRRRRADRPLPPASDRVVARALDVANVDAVFLPLLEALPLLGDPRRALVRLATACRRGDHDRGARRRSRRTSSMLVWPMRILGQRVADDPAGGRRRGPRSPRCSSAQPAVVETRDRESAPARRAGDVRFEDVRFAYEPRPAGARRVHARRSRPGRRVALVGETGSGKSTVGRAARALLRRRRAAACSIDGVDVRELRVEDLRHAVGIVFAETFLFTDTVRRQHRLRPAGRGDGGDRARRRGSPARTSSSSAARGIRHRARRARLLALGRPAAADRDRARDPRRPAPC